LKSTVADTAKTKAYIKAGVATLLFVHGPYLKKGKQKCPSDNFCFAFLILSPK